MLNPSPAQEAKWAKQRANGLARHVANLGKKAIWFLTKWESKHGKESAEKLRDEARLIWMGRRNR